MGSLTAWGHVVGLQVGSVEVVGAAAECLEGVADWVLFICLFVLTSSLYYGVGLREE